MKITKSQLKQLIQEELENVVQEQPQQQQQLKKGWNNLELDDKMVNKIKSGLEGALTSQKFEFKGEERRGKPTEPKVYMYGLTLKDGSSIGVKISISRGKYVS